MKMTPCQTCGRPIMWGETKVNTHIPLEQLTVDPGPLEFVVFVPHAVTCKTKTAPSQEIEKPVTTASTKEVMDLGKTKKPNKKK